MSGAVSGRWRALALAVLFGMASGSLPAPVSAQDPAAARAALRSGEYDDAIEEYRDVLRADAANADARVGLMQALVATGEYEQAVTVGREAPDPLTVANATGEALLRVGRLDEDDSNRSVDADAVERVEEERRE